MSDKFKISDLQSEALRQLAANVDKFGGDGNGAISKKEFKQLQSLLNGQEYQPLQAELAGEGDDIKKLFGYTGSVKPAQTTPAPQPAAAVQLAPAVQQQPVAAAVTYDAQAATSKEQQVRNAYYQYRGIDPVTRQPLRDSAGNPVAGLSPREAYEAVKKDLKGNKEFKDAVKDLKKYSIDTEAKFVVLDAISRTTATDSKGVKKQAEAILKAEGNWDKHTKKALNGNGHNWIANQLNHLSLRSSDMKLVRKAQAAGNRADAAAEKTYTKKDFTDAIGKRCPLFKEDENGYMVIEKLTNVNGEKLVTRKDGGFDISKLSEFISSKIGADNTLSRQQNKADSELEAIRAELRRQGVELTKRDTKQLIEFCGYRIEHKNWVKVAYDGTLGTLAGAAGTAVALGTQAKDVFNGVFKKDLHIEFNLNVKDAGVVQFIQDEATQQMIQEGSLQIIESGTNVQVLVDKHKIQPYFYEASRHIAINTLKAAGVGAAIGIVAGMLDYGPSEKNVFNRDLECCRTYEDFIAYVDARRELSEDQKLALKQIALAYIEETDDGKPMQVTVASPKRDENGMLVLDADGKEIMENKTQLKWDYRSFICFLNSQAGFGSNLNNVELLRAVQGAATPVHIDCDEVEEPEEPDEPDEPDEPCVDCETKEEEGEQITIQPREVKFRSWPDLVNGYDCLQAPEYKRVINGVALNNRMVKVIQAIDVSGVTTEAQLRTIYNIKTIAAFAEDAIRFGIDKAIENHPELPVSKDEYQAVVSASAGLKGNAYVPALYDPDTDDTCDWTKKADVAISRGTGRGTTATLTRKGHTVNGEPTYWKKCPGSDQWVRISKAEYDALNG